MFYYRMIADFTLGASLKEVKKNKEEMDCILVWKICSLSTMLY